MLESLDFNFGGKTYKVGEAGLMFAYEIGMERGQIYVIALTENFGTIIFYIPEETAERIKERVQQIPYSLNDYLSFLIEFKDFEAGFLSAVNILVEDSNPLFDSLINKLCLFPKLNFLISRLLFHGQRIAYNADNAAIRNAQMFGFVKIEDSSVQIANKLFETRLYNRYLLEDKEQNSSIFMEAKEIGVKEIVLGDKVLVEAVV